MKLTNVLGSVNNNPEYYNFIPYQIKFWKALNINFYAVFVGEQIPDELIPYSNNIFLWNKCLDLNTAYLGQMLRIFYTALLNLPDDEMVMITDMDMLPCNKMYYTSGLENFNKEDFIYYRNIDHSYGSQIYMCYNAAHPSVWSSVFSITCEDDIENQLRKYYEQTYTGIPGGSGWAIDQLLMYNKLINYPHLHVLNIPIKRLETWMPQQIINNYKQFDDCHFHRSLSRNHNLILAAEKQICS